MAESMSHLCDGCDEAVAVPLEAVQELRHALDLLLRANLRSLLGQRRLLRACPRKRRPEPPGSQC